MKLTGHAAALAALMSDVSEEAFCAGWMSGLEESLWEIIYSERKNYGQMDISDDLKKLLKGLSESCGGWIRYDQVEGEMFVPLAEWKPQVLVGETTQ